MRVWSLFCGSGSVYQVAQGRNIGQGSLKNALRASLLWLYVQIWAEIEMRQEKTAPEGLSQSQIVSVLVFWGLSLSFNTPASGSEVKVSLIIVGYHFRELIICQPSLSVKSIGYVIDPPILRVHSLHLLSDMI